jgi:DNA-binding response OmpR family regulator
VAGAVPSPGVRVLLATDADWLVQDVVAALGGPDTSFTVCAEGREVADVFQAKVAAGDDVDVAIFDLQIGSMGGMAVTLSLRQDESSGRLPHVPIVMLLDRIADVFLARRSGADGWLVKPLDPLRLRRAVRAVQRGDTYHEGLVDGRRGVQPATAAVTSDVEPPDPTAAAESVDVVPAPAR